MTVPGAKWAMDQLLEENAQLLAENQRLRDALAQIIEGADDFFSNDRSDFDIDDTRDIARAALAAVRVEDER